MAASHSRPSVGRIGHLHRYQQIIAVLVRYGFQDVVQTLHLTPSLAAGRRVLSLLGRQAAPQLSKPQRIRLALEALGPTFVKFGQALSTHSELLPPEVIAELTLLQDAVAPVPPAEVARAIERAFGASTETLFRAFEDEPLASASIAQVHRAVLPTGEVAAIKIRRPGIEAIIEADLAILADLARLAERHLEDAALYDFPGLVDEFARTIRREQDLQREGRLIERVAGQFRGDDTVQYPRVYWPHTNAAVLTMEFLDGVKVSAVRGADAPDVSPALVARRGADVILKQVLVHGLFHADPHPGNILVLSGNVISFVDFGIVGRVSRHMRRQLTAVILAIHRRDAERLAAIVTSVSVPLGPVNQAELARDLEEMLDLYADVAIGDLSLQDVLGSVVAAMRRHRLKLPSDLLLLIKAVTTIESVGRQLDPSFKMVEYATPFVAGLVQQSHRPSELTFRMARVGGEAMKAFRTMPQDLATILERSRRDGLRIQFVHQNLDHFIHEMDRSSNRLSFAIVIAAVVIGSAVVMQTGVGPLVHGYPVVGVVGFVTAGVIGMGLALGILRSGRL
jgi:ubiquinone biosynthesis protein